MYECMWFPFLYCSAACFFMKISDWDFEKILLTWQKRLEIDILLEIGRHIKRPHCWWWLGGPRGMERSGHWRWILEVGRKGPRYCLDVRKTLALCRKSKPSPWSHLYSVVWNFLLNRIVDHIYTCFFF